MGLTIIILFHLVNNRLSPWLCLFVLAIWVYEGGIKVHKLTKKELSYNNYVWHALNSTFTDANGIFFFSDKPTLDTELRSLNSGTRNISWK